MEDLSYLFKAAYKILNYSIEIFGFTISFYAVLISLCSIALAFWFIRKLFE